MIAAIGNSATSTVVNSSTGRSDNAFADIMASTAGAGSPSDQASVSQAAARKASIAEAQADSSAKLKDALAVFKKEASLTPEQRARRDVLKAMTLTEEAIKAMPPEEQKTTKQKIAAEVSRRLRRGKAETDQMAFAAMQARLRSASVVGSREGRPGAAEKGR